MPVVKNDYICENCKYYDPDECYCMATGKREMYEEDTCDGWTDPEWPEEPTDKEKADIIGDRKAHEIMVEGDI